MAGYWDPRTARRAEEEAKLAEEAAKRAAEEDDADEDEGEKKPAPRRRARRPSRRKRTGPLEGTFDHGEEGYGLWLDPAIQDNAIYAEHWAGHRTVEVAVEEDCIVIRRSGSDD